jgi:hypothetical protein
MRGTLKAAWIAWAVLILACSDGTGSNPTSPGTPGPSPSADVLALVGRVSAEEDVGIIEVTVFLDGEEIGGFLSSAPEGQSIALVGGTKVGAAPGSYVVEYRFDRLSASPAVVEVKVTGLYDPAEGAVQELDFGSHDAVVAEGDSVAVPFDL